MYKVHPFISVKPVAEEILRENGFVCRFAENLGEAKHVFTHRVWNMKILHFELESIPESAQMVNGEELSLLPFPAAMRAAVQAAKQLLENQK